MSPRGVCKGPNDDLPDSTEIFPRAEKGASHEWRNVRPAIFQLESLKIVFMFSVPHASLGISDPATVQNSAFNSSSEKVSFDYSAQSAPVDSASVWCAYYNDEHQWLEASIDYDHDHDYFELKALKSEQNSGMTWYLLNSSTDGKIWNALKNGKVRGKLLAMAK